MNNEYNEREKAGSGTLSSVNLPQAQADGNDSRFLNLPREEPISQMITFHSKDAGGQRRSKESATSTSKELQFESFQKSTMNRNDEY